MERLREGDRVRHRRDPDGFLAEVVRVDGDDDP